MASLSLIFSIAMDADYSFYVKFIATYAPTFFGYIISVLAMVTVVIIISASLRTHNLIQMSHFNFIERMGLCWLCLDREISNLQQP